MSGTAISADFGSPIRWTATAAADGAAPLQWFGTARPTPFHGVPALFFPRGISAWPGQGRPPPEDIADE